MHAKTRSEGEPYCTLRYITPVTFYGRIRNIGENEMREFLLYSIKLFDGFD